MKKLTKNRVCSNCGETEERIKRDGVICGIMTEANENSIAELGQEFPRHRYDKPKYEKEFKKPKNAFDFTCPNCNTSLFLTPSIAMIEGINLGHGGCTKCGEFLHLEIDDVDKKTAKAEKWDDYIKRDKLNKKNEKQKQK